MSYYFKLFGWGIELFAWVSFKSIFGGSISRLRYLKPMPRLHYPGAKINHAYAEAYCPVGGIAIDLRKDEDHERNVDAGQQKTYGLKLRS